MKDIAADEKKNAKGDVWRERGRVSMVFLTEALSETSCAQLTRSSLSYLQMQAFTAVNDPLGTAFALSCRL